MANITAETQPVPKTMAEALDYEDPHPALMAVSESSMQKAERLSDELTLELEGLVVSLPPNSIVDEISTTTASVDSIFNCLTKIATGGTQASQEIRTLEQEKRDLELHAQDVETALALRKNSDGAAEALNSQKYAIVAQCIHDFLLHQKQKRHTKRALAYAGEYTLQQMETTQRSLKETLLQKYQVAVEQGNLGALGELTPLLSQVELEKQAVSMYLQFLQATLAKELEAEMNKPVGAASDRNKQAPPPYVKMARVYNTAVSTLRHHLPMVSHFLHKADGDAAVVQLVHAQVEQTVAPLFQAYIQDRQLNNVARTSQRIYELLEERYIGRLEMNATEESLAAQDLDDCGFQAELGSLADVDSAMEEAALCLQHAESYQRFLQHTVNEVNKAREIRYKAAQEESKLERERAEWATGMAHPPAAAEEEPYKPLDILPPQSQLTEVAAEVGGYYSGIEHCLLLASMQRAFSAPEQYSDLGMAGSKLGIGSKALRTSLVDACLYAARRSVQRAFATGHAGTASAMANFCGDTIGGVLLEVMTRRAQETGISKLKPGDGLLEGSINLLAATTSNLMRQAGTGGASGEQEAAARQVKMQQGIARACATLNDLVVAAHHLQDMEKMLELNVAQGFPPNQAEQLNMCVRSFVSIQESFQAAANGAIETLATTVRPRIRSIVSDAVGNESSTSTSFMTSTVKGDRSTVRMNYNLDESAYKFSQLSEGYMARICASLDELIQPLQMNFEPRLGDALVLGVMEATCKRLEASLRRCTFTALGALALDSDMRDLLAYTKERLDSPQLQSNLALYRACTPLARLLQISQLLSVDDLEDVVDLISSSKRKGNWDLKLEDAKAFLCLRVEFEGRKVNQLLKEE